MIRNVFGSVRALTVRAPAAAHATAAAASHTATQAQAARCFSRSARTLANNSSSSSSSASAFSSSSSSSSKPSPAASLPLPQRINLAGEPGESGMDASGHWHEVLPPRPSHKQTIAREVYNNFETAGAAYVPPKHPNSPLAIHGIGVPSVRQVQKQPPRRTLRPHSVQDVPHPMKTYTLGPREMGYKIVRTFIGHVTSDKMQKTVAVEVSQYYRHPKYHKYVKTSKKFLAHDEEEECNVGDVVEIRVCRPLSKRKHFTLHRIIKPKLDIEDAAKLFVASQPEWKRGPDYKSMEQLAEEAQMERAAFLAATEAADDDADAAVEAANK